MTNVTLLNHSSPKGLASGGPFGFGYQNSSQNPTTFNNTADGNQNSKNSINAKKKSVVFPTLSSARESINNVFEKDRLRAIVSQRSFLATLPDNPSGYYSAQYVNMQNSKALRIQTRNNEPIFIQKKKNRPDYFKHAESIEQVVDTKSNFNISVYENAERKAPKVSDSMADITESVGTAYDGSVQFTPGMLHTPGSLPGDSPKKAKIIKPRIKSFRSNANMELLGLKESKSIVDSTKIGPKYKMMYHQERV